MPSGVKSPSCCPSVCSICLKELTKLFKRSKIATARHSLFIHVLERLGMFVTRQACGKVDYAAAEVSNFSVDLSWLLSPPHCKKKKKKEKKCFYLFVVFDSL